MASVDLNAVTKRFGAFTAVSQMSLKVADAEFVAILGPSGCGKTTTMNMIAGIEDVTDGTISFDGENVTGKAIGDRGVGFVFQNYAIFTHLTVRKNLAFGLEVRGARRDEIDKRVMQMAEFMTLSARLDEPSSRLSVNELQKLAIGRSAIVEPRIFLLDEPLSNLDAAFRERMRYDLRHLQRQLRQTMIYVTHDQIEAMGLADRIAVMNHGALQQFDSPAKIYSDPENVFVAKFIGAPSMNILRATLAQKGDRVAANLGGQSGDPIVFDQRLSDISRAHGFKEVLFGFRPENLLIVDKPGDATIGAEIEVVEAVGRRRIVHFSSGVLRFIGVFDRAFGLRAGETAHVSFNFATCHLFDPKTERRLVLSSRAGH
jgi:multiple sugar transport system ATP-binding protein